MKNKMRFIIPKLIGATLIVGLLTFVLGLLFKLLIMCTVLGTAIMLIAAKMRNRKSRKVLHGHRSAISPDPQTESYTAVRPQSVDVQSNFAIIPIH
ncbi:hypothetical protein ACFX5U_11355 [Sphingobacterium sp. SG20118]|uniref:hypothetical protein n=1 Tax=Sphingobacterium sp. SG20118 TaxID=3367156 RepID=UPI0037DFC5C3